MAIYCVNLRFCGSGVGRSTIKMSYAGHLFLFLSVPHSAIWLVYGHNTDSISWPWLLLWSSSDPDQAQSDNNNNNFGYRHVASCPFCSSFFASKLCHHHIAVPFRPGLLPSAKHTHITTARTHIVTIQGKVCSRWIFSELPLSLLYFLPLLIIAGGGGGLVGGSTPRTIS